MQYEEPGAHAEADEAQKPFWLARSTRMIFFFAAVLTLAGIYFAFQVPISVFPETNFPRVVIGIDNGVMPVEQMQVTITKPIEDAVNAVPGLVTVRSTTSRGQAEVSLFFDWNVDMYQSLQLVDAALGKVEQTLPSTAKITTNRLTFATFPILGYSLTSDTVPQTQLWEIATYDLKPPLNRVAGVSTVIVQGGKQPEFHVVPNLALMQGAGVTIPDLVNAIQASNIVDSPGLYEANHELILSLVGAQVHDADGLRQLVVKTTAAGAPVHVADVAAVEPGTLPVYTTVTANGNDAVLITIARQPSSNTVAVADAVAAQIGELRRKLPPGVKLDLFYDQSQLVRDSISSVRDAIFIGLILACIVLFLFLRDWTSSLIAGLVIPVTIAVTVLVLFAIGESFNLMTLGGLAAAIGLVIDDAIVVVENIVMHRDAGERRSEAVRKALKEITRPLLGSTITPVVVFLPLVSVTGVTGSFFRALAITMAAALLTSLMLALTWTPGLSMVLLKDRESQNEREEHQPGRAMNRVLQLHKRALDWALAKPLWVGAACLLLVAGTWAGYQALGSDLLPEMDEGGFILDYIMPAGSSMSETNRVLEHIERILRATPEVEITSRRTGLQMGLAAVTEANTGDFTVKLKAKRSRSIDDVMEDVRQQIRATEPELDIEFTQVLQDMIGDLSNAPEPIQIKIFTNDTTLLAQLGPRVGDAIGKIPGVVDVENGIDNTISGPATNFQVNPVTAARLGFTPAEVSLDATAILDGIETTDPLIANGRPYTIRIRLGDESRSSLDAIENTVFNSSSGHTASLGSLAEVQQLPPQNEIRRENLQQLVVVTGRLEELGPRHRDGQGQTDRRRPSLARLGARRVRRNLRGAAEVLPRPVARAATGAGVGLRRAPHRVSKLSRAHRNSHLVGALRLRRDPGAARYRDHVQCRLVHGAHHGHRHRGQERHPSARRRRKVPRRGRIGARCHAPRRSAPPAPHRHDCHRRRLRHVAAGLRARRRLADAAAAGHRRHRRPLHLHGPQPRRHAARLLPAHPPPRARFGRIGREGNHVV